MSPPATERARVVTRCFVAAAMVMMGVLHFAVPAPFVSIVPAALPFPLALVYLSGVAEVAGGAGLLVPRLRRAAGIGLCLLYVAVFPANVNMALHHIQPAGGDLPAWAAWARLPFQAVFIAVAWWVSRK